MKPGYFSRIFAQKPIPEPQQPEPVLPVGIPSAEEVGRIRERMAAVGLRAVGGGGAGEAFGDLATESTEKHREGILGCSADAPGRLEKSRSFFGAASMVMDLPCGLPPAAAVNAVRAGKVMVGGEGSADAPGRFEKSRSFGGAVRGGHWERVLVMERLRTKEALEAAARFERELVAVKELNKELRFSVMDLVMGQRKLRGKIAEGNRGLEVAAGLLVEEWMRTHGLEEEVAGLRRELEAAGPRPPARPTPSRGKARGVRTDAPA